jgi:hypothetical protein
MMNPYQSMQAAQAWLRFTTHYNQMSMAAWEVIMRRTMLISQGTMSAPEAMGMVLEKATAFVAAGEKAAIAAARGGDATKIASAALSPIRAKARANARRLRR